MRRRIGFCTTADDLRLAISYRLNAFEFLLNPSLDFSFFTLSN